MSDVNKQLLDALKSVTLSEEDIELERSVAPEEYDKARKLIAKADAIIVKELKDIEESCHHKKPELFAMIQEYGVAEHSQNDGLAIHLLSKIKEAIAAAEQEQQAEPVARIKTVGGHPDHSRHEIELLVKHGQLSDGQLLYAAHPPAVPNELFQRAENAVAYSQNFATAKPGIGTAEKEHIIGLCNMLSAVLSSAQILENNK